MIFVCMATYNGAKFLREQLDSILKQLDESAKIIVADDGSTDGTLDVLREYAARDAKDVACGAKGAARVQIIESAAAPLGPIYNLERSLQEAYKQSNASDLIFLADQDDVWLPGKVKQMVEALQNSALAIHDAYLLQELYEGVFERGDSLSEIRPFAKGLFKNWLKNRYTGCCMALHCELLDKALPFPKKLPMHDQWLGMIAEKFFDVAYVDSPLISYRQHKKNTTHIAGGGAGVIQKLKWRLDLLRAFWSRR